MIRALFLGFMHELNYLSEQAILEELPYGPKFLSNLVTRTPLYKQKVTRVVNIIGKMMVGGYAEVDPCVMLLYIHWIHFMAEMSQDTRYHLQRPMSVQEVDVHYFLANPELQEKLQKVAYYGNIMVKKLLSIEKNVFKSKHWRKVEAPRDW